MLVTPNTATFQFFTLSSLFSWCLSYKFEGDINFHGENSLYILSTPWLKATYANNRWPDVNDEIHTARLSLGIILLADFLADFSKQKNAVIV